MEHCPGQLIKMLVSDRRTMPHDRCFVGITKKVISTSGKGKRKKESGNNRILGRKNTRRRKGLKEGEKARKHLGERQELVVASAAEEKAGTDGRMALTGGGGGLGTARVLAPPNHDDALPFRGGQAPRQRASYLDPSQLFQLEEDFSFGCN